MTKGLNIDFKLITIKSLPLGEKESNTKIGLNFGLLKKNKVKKFNIFIFKNEFLVI